MKKIITALVLVAMLLTTLAVAAAAESYMDKTPATCEYEVTVKKADPSVVKKDGIIDVDGGEYVKADVPFSELSVNFLTADLYLANDAMAKTMEYYFSWDDIHGFNFAVKYFAKGNVDGVEYDGYYTNIDSGAGAEGSDVPQDNFMTNMGLCFATGIHNDNPAWSLLYYSIGKKLDGSSYLYGHWNQLGNSGTYSPVGGQDFEVYYPGDGSVIYEWSIPFAEIINVAPADGVSFNFTLSAGAGSNDWAVTGTIADCWSVSLGQLAWLVQTSSDNSHATAILSTELIKEAPATDAPVTDAPTQAPTDVPTQAPTQAPTEPVTSIVTEVVSSQVVVTDAIGEVVTDKDGEVVTEIVTEVVTSVVTAAPTQEASGNKAPVTGDPMVIAAVVAAISACGVVVAKKRK